MSTRFRSRSPRRVCADSAHLALDLVRQFDRDPVVESQRRTIAELQEENARLRDENAKLRVGEGPIGDILLANRLEICRTQDILTPYLNSMCHRSRKPVREVLAIINDMAHYLYTRIGEIRRNKAAVQLEAWDLVNATQWGITPANYVRRMPDI